jgi:hypothetical protein
MSSKLPNGAIAPTPPLLPLTSHPLPIYDIADDSGSNCRIWHQFYRAYADLFLSKPTKANGDDLRRAHAGLMVALDTAGIPVPRTEQNRVWDLIERLSA